MMHVFPAIILLYVAEPQISMCWLSILTVSILFPHFFLMNRNFSFSALQELLFIEMRDSAKLICEYEINLLI